MTLLCNVTIKMKKANTVGGNQSVGKEERRGGGWEREIERDRERFYYFR